MNVAWILCSEYTLTANNFRSPTRSKVTPDYNYQYWCRIYTLTSLLLLLYAHSTELRFYNVHSLSKRRAILGRSCRAVPSCHWAHSWCDHWNTTTTKSGRVEQTFKEYTSGMQWSLTQAINYTCRIKPAWTNIFYYKNCRLYTLKTSWSNLGSYPQSQPCFYRNTR